MLVYFYSLLSIFIGISDIWHGAVYPGLSVIVGPIMCWWAASGLKGSLVIGTKLQKLFGLGAAVIFVTIGMGIVYHSGIVVNIIGFKFSGIIWCIIGLALGWINTTRSLIFGRKNPSEKWAKTPQVEKENIVVAYMGGFLNTGNVLSNKPRDVIHQQVEVFLTYACGTGLIKQISNDVTNYYLHDNCISEPNETVIGKIVRIYLDSIKQSQKEGKRMEFPSIIP